MNTVQHLLENVCSQQSNVHPGTLEQVIVLAVEIAREGREGRKVGTLFMVGDSAEVEKRSRPLILDPLYGHPDEVKHIADANMRETAKELAQLDGGFVVTGEGVFRSAARYFNASAEGIDLPLGLGTRHLAGAAMSRQTRSVAVVVSESSVVRVFVDGELMSEVIPELWMLRRYGLYLKDGTAHTAEDMTVVSKTV